LGGHRGYSRRRHQQQQHWSIRRSRQATTNQIANFGATGDLALVARGDVNLRGADLNAGNTVSIQGVNVTAEAAKDRSLIDVQMVAPKLV
jgi:hypothetical protein